MKAHDGGAHLHVSAKLTDRLPADSIFHSLADASTFFEHGSLGYSATAQAGRYDGMELRCKTWQVTPLDVDAVQSSFFDDKDRFAQGVAEFDCALLMENIEHEWHSHEDLCCDDS